MRGIVYGVAAIAAIGIMFAVATTGDPADEGSGVGPTSVSADAVTMEKAGTLTLAVPEMHCSFSCFPKVKETLLDDANVESVELGPQKEEGVLDNRQVVVQYNAGFEVKRAIEKLEASGFTESRLVQ